MVSNEIIDTASLLEPISEDNRTGYDLREDSKPDSLYQQIKQARTSARAEERTNLYDRENNNALPHWKTITTLAPQILQKHSKDLEITSWFIESQVRINGFQGLRDSFKLTKGLIENFWDDIYPIPDEDGIVTRVAPLAGLNGEGAEGVLIAPIRNIAITDSDKVEPFSLWQYQQSLDVQKITDPDTRNETISRNGYSMEDIDSAVNNSSDIFYVNLRNDITDCITEFRQIGQLLDERCGTSDAPPTSKMTTVLEQCLGAVNHLAKDKFPVVTEATENGGECDDGSAITTDVGGSGSITSREAAFKQLHMISAFFLKTEPHSPISYVLAKAVKWGNMPLNDLIGELIPDNKSREYFSSLTGVNINTKN